MRFSPHAQKAVFHIRTAGGDEGEEGEEREGVHRETDARIRLSPYHTCATMQDSLRCRGPRKPWKCKFKKKCFSDTVQ